MDTEWEEWVNNHNLKFWKDSSTTKKNSNKIITDGSDTNDQNKNLFEESQKVKNSSEATTGNDTNYQSKNNVEPFLPGIECDLSNYTFDALIMKEAEKIVITGIEELETINDCNKRHGKKKKN